MTIWLDSNESDQIFNLKSITIYNPIWLYYISRVDLIALAGANVTTAQIVVIGEKIVFDDFNLAMVTLSPESRSRKNYEIFSSSVFCVYHKRKLEFFHES